VRRLVPIAAALAAVLALAGCGGKKTYTLEPTRACLAHVSRFKLVAVPVSEVVANSATGGALRVEMSGNEVTISFGADADEAARLSRGYQKLAGTNIGLADVLRPNRNAVLLWQAHPTEDDESTVKHCLK